MVYTLTQVSKLPTDEQMVMAIQHRKDLFTSRYMRRQGSSSWSTMDSWYFNHICTVLEHAKRVFETDVDSMVETNNNIIDE